MYVNNALLVSRVTRLVRLLVTTNAKVVTVFVKGVMIARLVIYLVKVIATLV